MRNGVKSGLEKQKSLIAFMLVYQGLACRVGAAHRVAHAAPLLGVAGLAGLGLELADHEAFAAAVGIELALGCTVAAAEAGVAGAGLKQLYLLVALDFVGAHGGTALVAGQLPSVVAGVATCAGVAAALAGRGEGRARLGLGGTKAQGAQQRGGKYYFHVSWKGEGGEVVVA